MAFEEKSMPARRGRTSAGARCLVPNDPQSGSWSRSRPEFDRFLGAAPYERTPARRGQRNGPYARTSERVRALVLDSPRDRAGPFQASLFPSTNAASKRWSSPLLRGGVRADNGAIITRGCGSPVIDTL